MDETLDKNKRTASNFFKIAINSTCWFILSYLFLHLIAQFATAIAAMQYDYTTIIYYYKLVYTINETDWVADAVKLLYSLGPLISLVFGIVMLISYFNFISSTSTFKLFFLWGFLHGIIMFFSAILVGSLIEKGIGYVMMYSFFMDTSKLVISLISLAIILIAAVLTTKLFLFSANSYFNQLTEHSRLFFVFSQMVFPAVIGTAIVILIKIPGITYYDLFISLTMLLTIIPILMRFKSYPTFFFEEKPIRIKLNTKLLIITLCLLIAFRIIFDFGVPIG